MSPAIELFTFPFCGYTERVRLALEELGLPYDVTIVDKKAPPDWFLAASPKAETPVARIDGTPITGSLAIIEAAAARSSRAPLGVVPGVTAAQIAADLAWIDEKLVPAYGGLLGQGNIGEQRILQPKVAEAWATVDAQVARSGGPYWYGALYSIVDVAVTPFLNRAEQLEYFRDFPIEPSLTHLRGYLRALRLRPTYQRVAPRPAELRQSLRGKASLGAPGVCSLLQHAIFRSSMREVGLRIAALQPAPTAALLASARQEWDWLMEFLSQHAAFEDQVFFPAMDAHEPGFSQRFAQEHDEDHHVVTAVTAAFDAARDADGESPAAAPPWWALWRSAPPSPFVALQAAFDGWVESFSGHLEREERSMGPLMKAHVPPDAQPAFMKQVMDVYSDADHAKTLVRSFEHLMPAERAQYANAFAGMYQKTEPQRWAKLMGMARDGLGPVAWADIEERVPGTTAALQAIVAPKSGGEGIRYGYTRSLPGVRFEDAMERVVPALKTEGFGVMTEIDVKGTLKKKLDVDFRKYQILGACNPPLALQVLQEEPAVGLFMPCNVIVYEQGDDTIVMAAKAEAMFTLESSAAVQAIGKTVDERLKRALDSL